MLKFPKLKLPAMSDESKPFLDHLADLRTMLLRCTAALVLGMLIVGPIAPKILALLKTPLYAVTPDVDQFLWNWEVVGGFTLVMKIVLWGGLLLAAPFMVFAIGAFVFPGLTEKEKRVILQTSGFAVGLFALGVFLAYRFCLPLGLKAMVAVNDWIGVRPQWTISSYITFALQFMIAFGIVFEMPVILVILGRIGIVKSSFLREKRRHVYVVLFIIAAVLTPPDVFSQMLMALPLLVLYEMCIWIVRGFERRDAAEAAAKDEKSG